jgi:ribonuclease H / adenosylcobalamin/alpha-ribazole phosphatase
MSGTLILVRHGRTAWNGERFLGQIDVPLDATGRRQAAELVGRLRGVRVDAILSSPLRRARDTAAPLAGVRALAVLAVDELAELDCGALQGELKSEHGKMANRDPDEPFRGGESLADAHRRAARVARRIEAELRAGRGVVVVGHYVVLQMLLGALRGDGPAAALDRREYRPAPGVPYAWSPRDGLRRLGDPEERAA